MIRADPEGVITEDGAAPGVGAAAKATFRGVFAVGEFRALWLAQILSVAGDQLARVAMTVLVFERTHSAEIAGGVRLVFGERRLRTLIMFGWLVTFYIVPMGLAVPYAASFHGLRLAVSAGLLFAAMPFGTAAGAVAFGRFVSPPQRLRWMGVLAVGACAVLLLCAAQPDMAASLLIFAASGACAAYQLAANAAFVAAVPGDRRSQAFGLANGGIQVFQGLWYVLAGALAEVLSPAAVIALSEGIGAIVAAVLAASWYRRQAVPS